MPHFAANLVFDGQKFIKNAYISFDDDGTIYYISSENEALVEKHGLSFYNGILCPGFVNSHCHLELSGSIPYNYKEKRLSKFIKHVIANRNENPNIKKIKLFDRIMFENGISVVGDISNTDISCDIKQNSKIKYHTFVELSGLNKDESLSRYKFGKKTLQSFKNKGLTAELTLHSLYSVSGELLNLVTSNKQDILSIHFMESPEEKDLFEGKLGNLFNIMEQIFPDYQPLVTNVEELTKILQGLSASQIILVHNVMLEQRLLSDEIFKYCLCPKSNMNISGLLPNRDFVKSLAKEFIVGTDSMVSNDKLCILSEIKLLADNFEFLELAQLLEAATLNGAKALKCDAAFGSLEIGKKPGLILIEDVDLKNLKLTESSSVKRLI
ncbi:MAG: amidohydrolase family protein [Bacteroidales bacterium]|nr:amidohydrolase family protein [Bacteroidales bacterium]